ncbi:MAG TPA: choice-of-anchor R domain-containing protein [Lacipirellulaceae bacterium]|nr:choice-of-anchor R domain-containing protein [Lacipirellulaceae bacterium]
MISFSRFTLMFAVALVLLARSVSHADIVFNNFGPSDAFGNSGLLLQGPDVNTIGDVNQAAAFTVGPTGALLTSVQLGVTSGGPGPATGPVNVVVAADAANLPGAALQNSIVNVTMNGNQVISAGFPATLFLAPNTQYWVIADAEGTFDGGWNFNSIGETGLTAGQTEGFAWSPHAADQRFAFRVQGRLIPEPTALALAMVGAIGLLSCSRRNRI